MEDHFKNIWYLEDKNERIKSIEEKEQLILSKGKSLIMNPNSDLLYKEAKSSFIHGNFIAAAITFYLTIEQYLLWSNQAKRGNVVKLLIWPKYQEIFADALENQFIDEKLERNLILYVEGCRDQIMHPKSIYHLSQVGLRRTSRESSSFGRKDDPRVYLGPLGCAKRALDLLFDILEYNC